MLTQRASGNKVLLGSTSATAQRLKSLSGCIIIPHVGSVLVSQMPSNCWIYNSNQNFWIVLNRLFGTWSNTSPPISTNCISLSLNAHFVILTPRKSSIAKTPILGPISPIYIHKICCNLVYISSSCTRVWLNIMTEHYLFVSDFGPRSGLSATTKSFLMWAVFGPSKPGHSRTSWHSAETYFYSKVLNTTQVRDVKQRLIGLKPTLKTSWQVLLSPRWQKGSLSAFQRSAFF